MTCKDFKIGDLVTPRTDNCSYFGDLLTINNIKDNGTYDVKRTNGRICTMFWEDRHLKLVKKKSNKTAELAKRLLK